MRGDDRRARCRAPARRAHRVDRDADDGAAGGRVEGRSRGWWSCAPSRPAFPLYGTLALQRRPAVLARAAAGPRRAGAAGAADAARPRRSATRSSIGQATFTIRGVIAGEPGRRLGAFSLGPRVLIDFADLAVDRAARLRQPRRPPAAASRCRTTRLDALVADAARATSRTSSSASRSYRRTEDEIGEDFDARRELPEPGRPGHRDPRRHRRVERDARVRPAEDAQHRGPEVRRRAQPRRSSRVYVLQVLALGLAGSLLGVALARASRSRRSRSSLGDSTPMLPRSHYGADVPARWRRASAIGAAGVAAVLARAAARRPPRQAVAAAARRERAAAGVDWLQIGVDVLVVGAALVGADRLAGGVAARSAWCVCAGFAGIAVVLHLAGARCSCALIAPLAQLALVPAAARRAAPVAARQPDARHPARRRPRRVLHPRRPRRCRRTCSSEFSIQIGRRRAGHVPARHPARIRRDGVRAFLARPGARRGAAPQLIPVLRARVVGVAGARRNLESFEDVRGRGSLAREYTDHLSRSTSRRTSGSSTGAFWDAAPSAEPRGVDRARACTSASRSTSATRCASTSSAASSTRAVTSIRDVDWRDVRAAAASCSCSGRARSTRRRRPSSRRCEGPRDAGRARALAARSGRSSSRTSRSSTSARSSTRIRDVIDNVTLAITVVGGLVLFSGVLILIGAVAMTKFQRVYEAAIFKTLGASTRD